MRAHLPMKAADETVRAKQGFLSDIFGICAASQHPTREIEGGIDMGQHKLFEAPSVFGIKIVQRLPLLSDASPCKNRRIGDFILERVLL